MTSAIATLPINVVHLIAAGEVIDSLAAVVRELAENALDAAATRISISVYPNQWRVRVADNGLGMALPDLKQAAAPHSTSKIRDRQDLWNITSLGFRGEALHSLAQLAQLEIVSRPVSNPTGWQLHYTTQGEPSSWEPVAIAPGTVVTAHEIFATWVARRAGFPPVAQQLRMIQATIHHLALCHPHVTWQVQQDDRAWFNLWAGKTARQILPQILRDLQPGDLQEWRWSSGVADGVGWGEGEEREDGEEREEGEAIALQSVVLIGLPDRCHRHRPDWIKVALNGRLVQLPELEQTILSSFRRMLPRDRFPICFLHLQVPPAQVDWNRHPAKSEIYLHQLSDWQAQVQAAIDQALRLSATQLPESLYSQRVGKLLKTGESNAGYAVNRSIVPESSEAVSSQVSAFRAIAQVHDRYILVEHPTGIWLVEQHIAHERVLYEQLCDRWQLVLLESPIVLNHLTAAQVEQLQRLELEVESFGEQAWLVRTAPELLAQRSDCTEALLELSLGGDLQSAQVATACRSAIRNGTPLTQTEMQTLIDQWQQTRHPRTCPHGRPICLTLEESSLARFFRRHWVIGKSHGI